MFGTLAVKVWDLRKVQGYMGRADITTTMGYVHHVPKTDDANALTRSSKHRSTRSRWSRSRLLAALAVTVPVEPERVRARHPRIPV